MTIKAYQNMLTLIWVAYELHIISCVKEKAGNFIAQNTLDTEGNSVKWQLLWWSYVRIKIYLPGRSSLNVSLSGPESPRWLPRQVPWFTLLNVH